MKLNVYSGLMSSCQESAHGLRSLLAGHDRGARARPERRRGRSSLLSELSLRLFYRVEILVDFIWVEAFVRSCDWL